MYFREHRFSEFWAAMQRRTWGLFLEGCIRVWMAVVSKYQTDLKNKKQKNDLCSWIKWQGIPWQLLQLPSFRNEQNTRQTLHMHIQIFTQLKRQFIKKKKKSSINLNIMLVSSILTNEKVTTQVSWSLLLILNVMTDPNRRESRENARPRTLQAF